MVVKGAQVEAHSRSNLGYLRLSAKHIRTSGSKMITSPYPYPPPTFSLKPSEIKLDQDVRGFLKSWSFIFFLPFKFFISFKPLLLSITFLHVPLLSFEFLYIPFLLTLFTFLSNLISLGLKEKVGGRVGVWGGYYFTTTCSYVLRT